MTFRDVPPTHDETAGTASMFRDCEAAGTNLRLAQAARAAVSAPPSIRYEDFRERPKPEIRVSEAAARLAAALELHL